jgi:hypothetical protein
MRDDRWDQLSDEIWRDFAAAWIAELQGRVDAIVPDLPDLFGDGEPQSASQFVVQMNFTASGESQWRFIENAFALASDTELGDLAAEPIEHLLSAHGEKYIGLIDNCARNDVRFATMLGLCYRNDMSDDVWSRLCRVRIESPSMGEE